MSFAEKIFDPSRQKQVGPVLREHALQAWPFLSFKRGRGHLLFLELALVFALVLGLGLFTGSSVRWDRRSRIRGTGSGGDRSFLSEKSGA